MKNEKNSETKASITALSVAMAYTRSLSKKYRLEDSSTEVELGVHLWNTARQSLGWSNWTLSGVISSAPYSMQESFFNSLVVSGYDSIILFRKLMIKAKIQAAIERGVKQIVFLGGGYDVRALVTAHQFPNVNVYELDLGETRAAKLRGIKSLPRGIGFDSVEITENQQVVQVGNNLKLIECDLNQVNLKELLLPHGFIINEDSLIIAEGVTAYLSEESNKKLLRTIAELLTECSEFLLSYLTSGPRQISALEQNALDESKETYQFTIDPNKVMQLTSPLGLMPIQKFDASKQLCVAGDASAQYYATNPNAVRECYYLLHKTDGLEKDSIDDVPEIEFHVPSLNPTVSYCQLL